VNSRPTRATPGGRAYLDLRKAATATGRTTDELLQLYALEGILDRLSRSAYTSELVLKGGVLLAAYRARRPTRDVDLAATDLADGTDIRRMIQEILAIPVDDGLDFRIDSVAASSIREEGDSSGVRLTISCGLASAQLQLHIDVNLGDPLWPPPDFVELPRLLGGPPILLQGYSVELVLAEKIVTAVQRASANTRWRDFVDIAKLASLTRSEDDLIEAIRRVAAHRRVDPEPLAPLLAGYADLAQSRWAAWRRKQRLIDSTPESFAELLKQVATFVDPLLERASSPGHTSA
jgi:predicted nucleotidyltransferase component of viral defense system